MIVAPAMPYPEDALEPCLSARTVYFHRRKQVRYVERTQKLVRQSPLEGLSLSAVVTEIERVIDVEDEPSPWLEDLFDQASQAWNHALMWLSMSPPRAPRHMPRWVRALEADWQDATASIFASGWVWLVLPPDGAPLVEATTDADRPRLGRPLAVMDVWEHAYYLDYPDAKAEYAETWWRRLADFRVAEKLVDGIVPEALR